MTEVNTQQLVALPYTHAKATLRFYEALLGSPLVPVNRGEGYLLQVGTVRLCVRRRMSADDGLPKQVQLFLDDLVGVVRRLQEAGIRRTLDPSGGMRDPNGHYLRLTPIYTSIMCRDVGRTEQFYALLGMWMVPSTPSTNAVLVLSNEVCVLREGGGSPECSFEVSVIGPTLSAIDALNRAGFGPFDLCATKIRDPDGRLVTFKYLL